MKWKRQEQSQKSQRKYIVFYNEEIFSAYFADPLEWSRCAVCFDSGPSLGDGLGCELFLILHLKSFASGAPVLDDTELLYYNGPVSFKQLKGILI